MIIIIMQFWGTTIVFVPSKQKNSGRAIGLGGLGGGCCHVDLELRIRDAGNVDKEESSMMGHTDTDRVTDGRRLSHTHTLTHSHESHTHKQRLYPVKL